MDTKDEFFFFLLSYQEEFQLVKYYFSGISISVNIKHKKLQNPVFQPFWLIFLKFCSQNLLHCEDVPIKCPKQFLFYDEFICRRACIKKFKSKFHVFGWFPGLQNVCFFEKFTAEQVLKPFLGRNNFLKPSFFGVCDSLRFCLKESRDLRALIRWVLEQQALKMQTIFAEFFFVFELPLQIY